MAIAQIELSMAFGFDDTLNTDGYWQIQDGAEALTILWVAAV
ncbi:MAG: hypothetical protein WCP64_01475 [Actinomycetes bacterium]